MCRDTMLLLPRAKEVSKTEQVKSLRNLRRPTMILWIWSKWALLDVLEKQHNVGDGRNSKTGTATGVGTTPCWGHGASEALDEKTSVGAGAHIERQRPLSGANLPHPPCCLCMEEHRRKESRACCPAWWFLTEFLQLFIFVGDIKYHLHNVCSLLCSQESYSKFYHRKIDHTLQTCLNAIKECFTYYAENKALFIRKAFFFFYLSFDFFLILIIWTPTNYFPRVHVLPWTMNFKSKNN